MDAQLENDLKIIKETVDRISNVILGDLSGRTGLIQAEKNTADTLEHVKADVIELEARVKSIENESMKRTAWAAGVGFAAGLGSAFFKAMLHDK